MGERSERPSAFDKAVELLARRTHFRAQIADKLGSRGYPRDEVEAAVGRLEDLGYLDDRSAARDFVQGKLARGPLGRRRLMADLSRRGVDSEVIREVLDDLLPDDENPAAREAAESWLAKKGPDPRPDALARHLARRGFSRGAVWSTLEALGLLGDGAVD